MSDNENGQPVEQPVPDSAAQLPIEAPETVSAAGQVPPAPQPATAWAPTAQPPQGRPVPEGARRGGVIAGAVLIVLGALLLFGRYAPWGYLWRLWPVIIIIGGIAQVFRPHGEGLVKRAAEGIGTVVVGVILLCNSLGVVPWSAWLNMLALWPLLIVGIGIELVGKGFKNDWVRAASNVLLTAGLLYGIFVLGPGWNGRPFILTPVSGEAVTFSDSASHDTSAATGTAQIRVGATRLTLGAGDSLASIKGTAAKGNEPKLASSVSAGVAAVTIGDSSSGVVILPGPDRSLDVKLDRAVTWDEIRIDAGATSAEVDVRELTVYKLSASIGASDLRLLVGSKAESVNIDVSGGAASVRISVPKDAEVVIESQSGLSAVDVPASFEHLSGIPAFGDSRYRQKGSGGPTITISLKSGASSLEILTY